MFFPKLFSKAVLFSLLAVSAFFYCDLPDNPGDPSNTAISPIIKTPDGNVHGHYLVDTVGKELSIGGAIKLPDNFDSIRLVITFTEDTLFDTMFTEYGRPGSYYDTLWKELRFFAPGIYYATFIPATSLNIAPVTANITMVEAEVMPDNHRPVISVTGNTVLRPGETCVLAVRKTDTDEDQELTGAIKGKPAGATFTNDTFTWAVPASFTGRDTVTFIVTDNGYPQQSDSEMVVITVTATPHPPLITVTGDCDLKALETCTLKVITSDEDEEQTLTVTMEGNPEGSVIKDDSLFIWTAPGVDSVKHDVTFTVKDDGDPQFSTSVTITLTVSADGTSDTPHWTTDTLTHSMYDTASYSLTLLSKWSDENDDDVTFSLLSEAPEGDAISDGEYTFTATAAAIGTHHVAIEAKVSGSSAGTLIIRLTVEPRPFGDPSLTSVKISAGTLTQQSSPVPDTMHDTVSYMDSTITVTPATGEPASSILVKGVAVTSGEASGPIALAEGVNEVPIKVTAPGDEGNKTYLLYVVRKPNSTIALTTPPAELSATTISGSSVKVRWDDVFGANSYTVQRSGKADGTFATIGTATGNTHTDTGLASDSTYYYRVNASNSNNSTGYCEAVSAKTWGGPAIGTQPTGVTVNVGETITLSVTATVPAGSPACTYQWKKDEETLVGKTDSTLKIPTATMNDAGKYLVVVDNSVKSVESNKVTVVVNPIYTLSVTSLPTAGGDVTKDKTGDVFEAGTPVKLTAAPASGYKFDKWTGDVTGSAATVTITMSKNITVTANFVKVYSVTYNGNNQSSGSTPVDAGKYETGATVTVKGNTGSLLKTGYIFDGWNTKADGSGTTYAAGATFEMDDANVTLYAYWTQKSTFSVTYNGNNQSSGSAPSDAGKYETGATVIVKGNTGDLAKTGFTFDGWNTKADGSGISYAAANTFFMGDANVILHAKWSAAKCKVTFDARGGTAPTAQMVTYEGFATEPTTERTGFKLKGWYKEVECNNQWVFTNEAVTEPVTLYAKWIVQDYDGNVYDTVRIGTQTWLVQNLKTTKYNDGTSIPLVTDASTWEALSTPGYCWYDNDNTYKNPYGALYNWYTVSTGKLAPKGWHVPTNAEWIELEQYLIANGYNWDGTTTGNMIAKSMAATTNWNTYSDEGVIGDDLSKNNKSGFSALPGGYRSSIGVFSDFGSGGIWCSATEFDATFSLTRTLYSDYQFLASYSYYKMSGFSVRCVRD